MIGSYLPTLPYLKGSCYEKHEVVTESSPGLTDVVYPTFRYRVGDCELASLMIRGLTVASLPLGACHALSNLPHSSLLSYQVLHRLIEDARGVSLVPPI